MHPNPKLTNIKVLLELDIELGYSPEYPNSAFIELDYNTTAQLGGHQRIPVILSVDGHKFRSSLAPMGGKHVMVFNLQMRQTTGYKAGDHIHILLERDVLPRTVEVPSDVQERLQSSGAWDSFTRFSYSHQKEHIDWINEAKKPETRERRIEKLVSILTAARL